MAAAGGWAWAKLSEITAPVSNIDPRKLEQQEFTYIDLSAIDAGHIRKAEILTTKDAPSRAKQLVRKGDTLFSCVRVYLKNIGFVTTSYDSAIASTAYCVLRPREGMEPRYLYWFVNWQKFTSWTIPLQRGNSPPAVVDGDVKGLPLPLPPLPEQRRIVARIDELFAEIAEGEAALERARSGLDTWRRTLLKAAVTGKLTRHCREEYTSAESADKFLTIIGLENAHANQIPRRGPTAAQCARGAFYRATGPAHLHPYSVPASARRTASTYPSAA